MVWVVLSQTFLGLHTLLDGKHTQVGRLLRPKAFIPL
jgi:hypothetical protein